MSKDKTVRVNITIEKDPKAAERDLDKAIKALDDLRAAEHEARVQPRLLI